MSALWSLIRTTNWIALLLIICVQQFYQEKLQSLQGHPTPPDVWAYGVLNVCPLTDIAETFTWHQNVRAQIIVAVRGVTVVAAPVSCSISLIDLTKIVYPAQVRLSRIFIPKDTKNQGWKESHSFDNVSFVYDEDCVAIKIPSLFAIFLFRSLTRRRWLILNRTVTLFRLYFMQPCLGILGCSRKTALIDDWEASHILLTWNRTLFFLYR